MMKSQLHKRSSQTKVNIATSAKIGSIQRRLAWHLQQSCKLWGQSAAGQSSPSKGEKERGKRKGEGEKKRGGGKEKGRGKRKEGEGNFFPARIKRAWGDKLISQRFVYIPVGSS